MERVVVLGQGYVGLPLAVRAAEVGFDVVGFDVDERRVGRLRCGDSFIEDVTPTALRCALDSGRYRPSSDAADLDGFDVAVISVPTPLRDGVPELRSSSRRRGAAGHVRAARRARHPRVDDLPRHHRGVGRARPRGGIRARVRAPTSAVGYSPERIDPGNPRWNLRNTPKIVSGVDARSLERSTRSSGASSTRTVPVPGPKEAELAKLLENTFRHVNIALVNELAVFADELGIDIWAVIDAAATKPFGFMRFTPGPGVGGHCLPIDPSYLSWRGPAARSAAASASSSSPTTSTTTCPTTSCTGSRAAERRGRSSVNGRTSCCSASRISRTRATRASRRRSRCRAARSTGRGGQRGRPARRARACPAGICSCSSTRRGLEAADLVVVLTDHADVDWELVERFAGKVSTCGTGARAARNACDRLRRPWRRARGTPHPMA